MINREGIIWATLVLAWVFGLVAPQQCTDMPPFLHEDTPEDTPLETVLFSFTMEMDGVKLHLESQDNFVEEDYIDIRNNGNDVEIFLIKSLSLTSINPRPSEPEPDTDEELSCNHTNGGDALPDVIYRTLTYDLVCTPDQAQEAREKVVVAIEEVNDFEPEFMCDPYNKQISELTPVGTTVFITQGLTFDPDVEGGIFGYGIQESSYFGAAGHYTRGVIILTNALDYDYGERHHVVNITVEDTGFPRLSNTANILFDVVDGDDQDPEFANTIHELWLQEENSSLIGQFFETEPPILAYDLDFGINASIQYRLLTHDDGFEINETSAEISPKKELDREEIDSYVITVEAFQVDDPLTRKAQSELLVHVIDINDNAPEMTQSVYDVTIEEHLQDGSVILVVSATDLDAGVNAEVDYYLSNCSIDALTINSSTGHVVVADSSLLDREINNTVTCHVNAKERKTAEQWSSETSDVIIVLADINDNTPQFMLTEGFEFNVPSQLYEGTVIGKVEATDADEGTNAQIIYSINAAFSDDSVHDFAIEEQSGEIYCISNIALHPEERVQIAVEGKDKATMVSSRRSALTMVYLVVNDTATAPTITTPVTAPQSTDQSTKESESTTSGNERTEDTATWYTTRKLNTELTESSTRGGSITNESADDVTTVTTTQNSCQCDCPTTTTEAAAAPSGEDDSSVVFLIVIGLLSIAMLLLFLVIVYLLAHQRHRYKERVDKSSSTESQSAVRGIQWVQSDTASLLAHEEYLTKTFPGLFSQLEGESSTEGLQKYRSIGTDPRSSLSSKSTNMTQNNDNFIGEEDSTAIYHVPMDLITSLGHQNEALISESTRSPRNLFIQFESEATIETPSKVADIHEVSTSDDGYDFLHQTEIPLGTIPVPKLDLSTICGKDDEEILPDEEQFSYCRAEETIEIDIPCDSPRSSNESRNESTRSKSPPTLFIEVKESNQPSKELSVRPVSFSGSQEDVYMDMNVDPEAFDTFGNTEEVGNKAEIVSISGISMLDNVIEQEERKSERNSGINYEDCLFNPNLEAPVGEGHHLKDALETDSKVVATNEIESTESRTEHARMDSTDSTDSIGDAKYFAREGSPNRMPSTMMYATVEKRKEPKARRDKNNTERCEPDHGGPEEAKRSSVASTESAESIGSTVKVINDLPAEKIPQENSNLYVDHTFFTSGGPVTFL